MMRSVAQAQAAERTESPLPRHGRRHITLTVQATVAALVIVTLLLTALLAPFIAPYDPGAQDLMVRLMPPSFMPGGSPGHWLGTDALGRDILSRVIFGSRVSMSVGVVAVLISGTFGTAAGIVGGYFGRLLDQVLMRLADIQLAFPSMLLALAILAVLGPGFINLLLVLGLTGWVTYARVIRSQVLSLREREYVVAARALGARDLSILLRHILPNAVAPLIVLVHSR